VVLQPVDDICVRGARSRGRICRGCRHRGSGTAGDNSAAAATDPAASEPGASARGEPIGSRRSAARVNEPDRETNSDGAPDRETTDVVAADGIGVVLVLVLVLVRPVAGPRVVIVVGGLVLTAGLVGTAILERPGALELADAGYVLSDTYSVANSDTVECRSVGDGDGHRLAECDAEPESDHHPLAGAERLLAAASP
jgi:hypothetical protein